MHTFSVWAPDAETLDVVLHPSNERIPMSKDEEGWFVVDVTSASAGTRYFYSVDGADPVPDPRSFSQPEGVHGPSEVVDHESFEWHDRTWRGLPLPSATIYEMHVGTFTPLGTFASAIEKLDHLVELGISCVEVLPIADFSGEHGWGYDGVDLYAPHHAYGGPEGFKLFVDACHGRGLGVVLDVVYNHLGPSGNYLNSFGPYFTDKYGTPWGSTMNYDGPGSDEVRRYVLDNALMWFRDYHVDGLRLDAVHSIFDFSAVHVLEALDIEVEQLSAALGRTLFLIAESDLNDPRVVENRERGGYGMDAQWSDDFHHALHAVLTGETDGYYGDFGGWEPVAHALENTFVYTGQYQPSRGRSHGRPPLDLPGWRFLGYLQNHDQIGNRARGERSAALMSNGRAKIGAALVLLSPFVPMLFQGEEWAASTPFQYFTDHDEELGKLVSEGRKNEFGHFGWDPNQIPDPQAESTFTDSKLNWDEVHHPAHQEMLGWHKALLELRRTEHSLLDGGADLEAYADGDVFLVRRGEITIVSNIGSEAVETEFFGKMLLSSGPATAISGNTLVVEADGVAVLREG